MTVVVSSLLWSSSAMAQQRHVVDPAQMRQAVADQALTDQQNRKVVLSVLRHSRLRNLANSLGLSVTRAESTVATLDSAELASLARPALMADAQLAGGMDATIVISVTALLLIIIIVILVGR